MLPLRVTFAHLWFLSIADQKGELGCSSWWLYVLLKVCGAAEKFVEFQRKFIELQRKFVELQRKFVELQRKFFGLQRKFVELQKKILELQRKCQYGPLLFSHLTNVQDSMGAPV